jgi:hypothetical protein
MVLREWRVDQPLSCNMFIKLDSVEVDKMKTRISVMLMAAIICGYMASGVVAQDSGYARGFEAYDSSPVFKVMNKGNENVTFQFNTEVSTGIVVVIGGVTNTFDAGTATYDTVAELAAAIEALTNSAGLKPLTVKYWCSLGTDTISNKVLTATNTIAASKHEWTDIGVWDTSTLLAYPVAVAPGDNPKVLKSIDGNVAGTGNITLDVYSCNMADNTQAKIGTWSVVSPIYVAGSMASISNVYSSDDVTMGIINMPVNVPVGRGEAVLVRASRATTATTGGVGITVELRK